MDIEKISAIAQEICFAFEDHYLDKEKCSFFEAIFERYLSPVNPAGDMEPYDAIVLLGRKSPSEFERMVGEIKDRSLITD